MLHYDVPIPLCFEPREEGRFAFFLRSDCAEPLTEMLSPLDTLWERLERAAAVARGRASVARWPLPGRQENVILRRYMHGGLLSGLTGELFLGMSRPLWELALSERARECGAAVPLPLGAVVERRFGPLCRAVYLSAETAGAEDLVHFCCRMAQDPPETAARELRLVVSDAARQTRALHDAGVDHADLHLKNLLVHRGDDGLPHVSLIDLDKARARDPQGRRFRLRNLARLARSAQKQHVAREVLGPRQRLRFLREYMRGMEGAESLWPKWVSALGRSGRWREGWWALTGADRNLPGDRVGGGT